MLRLLSILFVLTSVVMPASAFAQSRGTVTCSYFEPSQRSEMSFGYDVKAQIVDAVHEYQIAENSDIDVKSSTSGERLDFNVLHYRDGFVVQHDLHEINLRLMDVQSFRLNAAGEKIDEGDYGYCDSEVKISLGEPVESKCVKLGFGVMMFSDREVCVNDHLRETKENTYDAEQLWQEGAWCVSGESQLATPPAATLKFYPFEGNPNLTARYLIIENGYAKNEKVFTANRRAKTVLLTAGNSLFDAFQLHDTSDTQYIDVGWDVDISEFKFHILDYYAGTKHDDVCISMIDAYMEEYPINPAVDLVAEPVRLTDAQLSYFEGKPSDEEEQIVGLVPPVRPDNSPTSLLPASTHQLYGEELPSALNLVDYKMRFGWPEEIADYKLSVPSSLKFTIIDGGFHGLETFLRKRPQLAARVQYFDLGGGTDHAKGTHGLDVLKVANEVLPAGQIYLFDVSLKQGDYLNKAIDLMVEKGLHYGTMSLGPSNRDSRKDLGMVLPKALQRLERNQITLFVASGNNRNKTHSVKSLDTDGDGFIEFWPDAESDAEREGLVFHTLETIPSAVKIGWGQRPDSPGIAIAQMFVGGELVAEKKFKFSAGGGAFPVTVGDDEPITLKVAFKGVDEEFPIVRVIEVNTMPWDKPWNGLRSSTDWAIWDSPFVISVGSVGAWEGKLAPSGFSSIDISNQGEVVPLVLGPGQFFGEDGELFHGTSFSTPFLAALYAQAGSHNIRNYIEASTGTDALVAGLSKYETGRWGVPVFGKVLGNNSCLQHEETVMNSTIDENTLDVSMKFSRRCMEGLTYFITMELLTKEIDPEIGTHAVVTETNGGKVKKLVYRVKSKSDTKHIEEKELSFELSLSNLSNRFIGAEVFPRFRIVTAIDRSGQILFDGAETFRLPSN